MVHFSAILSDPLAGRRDFQFFRAAPIACVERYDLQGDTDINALQQ